VSKLQTGHISIIPTGSFLNEQFYLTQCQGSSISWDKENRWVSEKQKVIDFNMKK
jgi:hypothetical protein